ncbi:acyl-CoA thioesterase [Pseudarthrobacter raffinosi]|uniref:acyl-CoA thioesterase n=1 Tax=Pseudarthrobacter raffinosi TaxID=2953651 RepID=UPI00208ECC79|nr:MULTISPECIES: thioesterase family protein [unclassified Pseudarthrobacter]MCO4251187.1 acyl-CoA thioesterase [Pseudarthrobacter sp. MDT3-9]MCO4265075.1 acyl-CoA thioesterase [Pseudarthrobacter sp. MDT3-26]
MTTPLHQKSAHPEDTNQPHKAFRCEIAVRWSDQDANGHVNNARVVTLMEEARLLWLNQHAVAAGVGSFTDPKFVVALTVNYLKPISYGPALVLLLTTGRIGNRSFTVSYEGLQDSNTVFRASTVLVPIDTGSGRPRALTDEEIAYLGAYAPQDLETNDIGVKDD